jgi:hypothetical protein
MLLMINKFIIGEYPNICCYSPLIDSVSDIAGTLEVELLDMVVLEMIVVAK